MDNTVISIEQIRNYILFLRRQKVILDYHLAQLYGVSTKALIQAVKRNSDRFPEDFMFQLKQEEFGILRSQIVTSNSGGRRYLPYAFTEQGIAMLSSVLHSKQAIQVNIEIMREFVRIRKIIATDGKLAQKLFELERKYDNQFRVVFEVIHQLIAVSEPENKRPIGFAPWSEDTKKKK